MSRRYLHFTNYKGAEGMLDSGVLWQSSYGPQAAFAVVEGGSWVPGVQLSAMGRAPDKTIAVVFTTDMLPDLVHPEEAMWHMKRVPINVVDIIDLPEAKKMLDGSLSVDSEFELIEIPHHPAFNVWGDWTRMPEDFEPWLPGRDNEKYTLAQKIWFETQDIKLVREVWKDASAAKSVLTSIKEATEAIMADCLSSK